MEAEVSLEVAPACLPAFGVDLVVGPPAVGAADAGKPLAEEFLEPVAVAVGRDQEDRRLGRGRGPERPVFPGRCPACLVDVDRRRAEHRPNQGLMRLCERECAASADRVDSPDRQADPEQLPGELGQVTARDPVTRGQRHDRGLQPRPERRVGDRGREAGGRPAVAARAAQTVRPMLGHDHRDRRQLRDLTPARTPRGQLLVLAELVPAAAAAVRVVVDELVDLILGRQRTAGTLMPRLTPGSASFAILGQKLLRLRPRLGSPLLTRLRRILRRRLRPSPRALPRLLLKTPDPLLQQHRLRGQPLHRRGQLKNHLNATIPPRVIDRLGLRPLHTVKVRRRDRGPFPGIKTTERLHVWPEGQVQIVRFVGVWSTSWSSQVATCRGLTTSTGSGQSPADEGASIESAGRRRSLQWAAGKQYLERRYLAGRRPAPRAIRSR